MIFVRWITTLLLVVAIPSLSLAAPLCEKQRQLLQVQRICKATQNQCLADGIPERKVIKCGANPVGEVGYSFVGCLTGVFKSVKDLIKFIFAAGKFILTLPFSKERQNKVAEFTQTQALNISVLQGYVKREYAVTKRNMGIAGKIPIASDIAAAPIVAKKIMGPLFKSLANSIEDFAAKQIHNFGCYNAGNRAEMLCKVAADILLPPAGAFALWKTGGKILIDKFPNLARAFAKIGRTIAGERKVQRAAQATKAAETARAGKAATKSKVVAKSKAISKTSKAETAVAHDMHETWRKGLKPGAVKEHPVPQAAFHGGETPADALARLEKSGAKGLRVNEEGKLVQNINRPASEVLPSLMEKNNLAPAKEYVAAIGSKKIATTRDFDNAASEVHEVWMKNNSWQKESNPQLFKDYKELTADEKLKDLDVVASVLKTTNPKLLKSKEYLNYRKALEEDAASGIGMTAPKSTSVDSM